MFDCELLKLVAPTANTFFVFYYVALSYLQFASPEGLSYSIALF